MTGAWQCIGAAPRNGGFGATEVITWAAASERVKRVALRFAQENLQHTCRSQRGAPESRSSDGADGTSVVRPGLTMRYVEGDRWLAFVGSNAPLRRVAATLGEPFVVEHCKGAS
jgi:hypothetical protein